MSDKAEKKAEAAPADKKEAAKGGGLMTKLPVILGGAMLLEAVVLFAGFKFLGGGAKNSNAADLTTVSKKDGAPGDKTGSDDKGTTVELQVVDSKFPNKLSGHEFLYDVSIFVTVKTADADKVKGIFADRDALIKDRIRTIIAQSDPEKLGGGSEPGLETLRRQVKYQLDEIAGEGMIDEVLVPRCIPYRADY
jgi:flagellar basal body-associated protein FliL